MSTQGTDPLRDTDIRPALCSHILDRLADVDDTAILEELGICRGQVRADLAVVNGQLHGYEIKSDRDTSRRLAGQADSYSKVFDRATLVVGEQLIAEALAAVPDWWGILQLRPSTTGLLFKTIRRARSNPRRDPRSLVEFLWLADAIALLEQRGVARGARGKPRRFVWDRICEHFDVDEIAAAVRNQLKARAGQQVLPQHK